MYSDVNTFCITGLSDCVLALGFEKMSRGSLKSTVSIIKKSKYCEKNLYTQPIIDSVSNACLNTH
jgi:acetyl-CoA acetyltransferase